MHMTSVFSTQVCWCVCVFVLRPCLESPPQTLWKDHWDIKEDVFTPFWAFYFLFVYLALPLHPLALLYPLFPPFHLLIPPCNIVVPSLGGWLCRSMSQDSLQAATDSFVYRGAKWKWKSLCVSACVVNLPWQMRLASSEDELTLVHTLKSVFVFSHSLPAGSLGICNVTFRNVNACTQTHTRRLWSVQGCWCVYTSCSALGRWVFICAESWQAAFDVAP